MSWRQSMRSVVMASGVAGTGQRGAAPDPKAIRAAAEAVSAWEGHIEAITSVHTNLADAINWHEIADKPRPIEPKPGTQHQDRASHKLAKFKPGVFDFMGGGSEKVRVKLERANAEAPDKDKAEHDKAMAEHADAVKEWETDTTFAQRILAADPDAVRDVLNELKSLSGDGIVGSDISFTMEGSVLHAMVAVHSDDIVPTYKRKQLKSGKLAESKMPESEANLIYQDYVASCALKIAGDLFRALPFDENVITCQAELLNERTELVRLVPVLSVKFTRAAFEKLKLEKIDPSDSLRNFEHAMAFSKGKGFAEVEPLVAY